MAKVERGPVVALFPVPTTMVSCAGREGRPNIITIAWVGTLCSDPPHVGIAVRRRDRARVPLAPICGGPVRVRAPVGRSGDQEQSERKITKVL